MVPYRPDVPRLGPEFFENQRNYPSEELLRYAGQYVAWSWDGTQIVASAPDDEELCHKMLAAGLDPSRTVIDYIDAMNDCEAG